MEPSLFEFTAYLQDLLNSLPFWIYSIFTGSEQQSPLVNLQDIYRVCPAVSLSEFTEYLQDLQFTNYLHGLLQGFTRIP